MRREPLPSDLPAPLFRVAAARDAGVPRHRLRTSDLRTPHRGLRSLDDVPDGLFGRCLELLPLLGPDQCFSHVTAALLWGLPVPLEVLTSDALLHVTALRGSREPRRRGVVGHRCAEARVMSHAGLPIVSPLRAWTQCAETFGLDDLVVMGDALVSKWSPYGPARFHTLSQLKGVVDRCAGRRGAHLLQAALALVRLRSWSPKETELRLFVRRCGCLEPPQLNRRMFGIDGTYLGRPDMAYEKLRIGIEYEGDHHRTSAETFRRDISRRERFADAGWRIIRVTEADIRCHEELAARLVRLLPRADPRDSTKG